jgi:hypothetical protein
MTGKGTLFAPADQSTPVVVGNFSYDELARNPARHIGAPVSFSGKVVQALKNGRDYTLRVNVSRGQFNIWKDTVFVEYHTGSAQRILEEDIIDFRGKFAGIKSYTTVLGATVPIPYVIADAIKDNGREDVQSPQWKTPETIVTKGYCRSLRISVGECDACTRRMTNQQCDEFKQKREECSREGWWLAEIGPVRKYVNPYVDPCPE